MFEKGSMEKPYKSKSMDPKMTPSRKAAISRKKLSSKSRLGSSKFIDSYIEEKCDMIDSIENASPSISNEEPILKSEKKPIEEKLAKSTVSSPVTKYISSSRATPVVLKSIPAIRALAVVAASPLRQVAYSASSEENDSDPLPSKRKREDDNDDQENFEPLQDLKNREKRSKISKNQDKPILFVAPRLIHQSWLDRSFSKFSKNIFGF
jgi:hypothetical protein